MSDFSQVILIAAAVLSGISLVIFASALTAFSGASMERGDAEGKACFEERKEAAHEE